MSKKKLEEVQNKASVMPREVKGLLLLAVNILVILSILSFETGEPSGNWLGLLGYAVSWIVQYCFGIGSLFIITFVGWLGWRLLCNKPVNNLGLKSIYFGVLLFSGCCLLNLLAETQPGVALSLENHAYSEYVLLERPVPHYQIRQNLGGVPAYYMFRDMPIFNFQRVLNNMGTGIVFGLTFLT